MSGMNKTISRWLAVTAIGAAALGLPTQIAQTASGAPPAPVQPTDSRWGVLARLVGTRWVLPGPVGAYVGQYSWDEASRTIIARHSSLQGVVVERISLAPDGQGLRIETQRRDGATDRSSAVISADGALVETWTDANGSQLRSMRQLVAANQMTLTIDRQVNGEWALQLSTVYRQASASETLLALRVIQQTLAGRLGGRR